MNKLKKIMETTDNSREYKMAKRDSGFLNCPICPPNQGCNRYKGSREYKSWKYWRKTKYRDI